MIAVQPMLDTPLLVNLIYYLIRILFSSSCENSELIVQRHLLYEFFSKRSNMKNILIHIKMNQSLVKIQNEMPGMVSTARRKKRIRWHFKYFPFQCFINKSNKLKGVHCVGTYEQTFEQLNVGHFSFI